MSDPSKVLQYALTGTVPIANGGTNSTTALSGSSIMISDGSKIVQGAAGTSTTVLHGSSGGAPTYSAVSLINDVTGTLPTSRGGTGVTSFTVSGVLYGNGSAVGSLTPVNNAVVSYTGAGALQATTTLPAAVQSNITALGTIGTGTWNGTAISASSGGTGQTTYAIGDILSANTTSTLSKIADVATGNALISGGVGVLPAWGKIGLTTHVSGTLPATNGGTNSATALSGSSIMVSNGTGIVQGAAGTTSTVLHGNAAGAPTYGAVALASEVSGTLGVANGGSGATTLTANGVLFGNGTSAVGALTPVNNAVVSYTGAGALQATTTLPSAVQANITTVGTIGTGVWQGTAISAGNGGTGFTGTMLNGVLPIGNGSGFTKANLTAGNGISIVNGSGSITINNASNLWVIRDEKTANTAGGGCTAGATAQRNLTIIKYTSGSNVTLSTNDFTLDAGTWEIEISAPAYACGLHRCELYSVTLAGVVSFGSSEIAPAGTMSRSCLTFLTTNAASHTYRVRHWTQNTVTTNGFGIPNGSATETYTWVNIRKIGA